MRSSQLRSQMIARKRMSFWPCAAVVLVPIAFACACSAWIADGIVDAGLVFEPLDYDSAENVQPQSDAVLTATSSSSAPASSWLLRSTDNGSSDWWKTAAFYQIYPRSFKDSNGDGIGDLNGIIEKLPYLVSLGVQATWLSPIFKSPMADFGYDISNYLDIQPEYGTLADFDRLIERAQQLGIKILLDFVPNHTSDEHEWFRLSALRDPHFVDFYVWHPGFKSAAANSTTGGRRPPNNWVSVFSGSAWEWNDVRQEFYYHAFTRKQPDLNYRNPRVVEMMHSVLRFWLNRGVAGFRVDAVSFLFEVPADAAGNYPDEPLSGYTNDPNNYGYLRHIYTTDMEETVWMVYQWRHTLDEFRRRNGGDERVMMVECYSDLETVMKFYGNATSEGAHIPFNFQFISDISNKSTAHDYAHLINAWVSHMPPGRTPNWVVGNHDNNRVAARLGSDRVDAINTMLLMLPGVSVTYNGEELGMTDVWISWKDTVDPAACNTNATVYEHYSRDPERTPFQWDDSTSAGFSSSTHTWLPIGADYRTVNVRSESAAANSHLQCYRKLMALRSRPALQRGALMALAVNDNVLGIVRSLKVDDEWFVAIINMGARTEIIVVNTGDQMRFAVVGVNSKHNEGDLVEDNHHIIVEPHESFVLRTSRPKWTAEITKLSGYYAYDVTDARR